MKRMARAAFIVVAILLLIYAAIFPLLTLDTLSRLLSQAAAFAGKDLLLLLFLELSRVFTTVVAILIAAALLISGRRRSDARALALFLLLAAISYEKVFGSNSYPGHLQERLTNALLNAGVSHQLLFWLFGPVVWTVWFAAAALLRFSVTMPRDLDAAALDASGLRDRRGLLRGKGVGGADIGALFRSASARIARSGAYRVLPLTIAAAVLAALNTLAHGAAVTALLYIIALTVVCVVITNIRAAHGLAEGADRARVTWIGEGFIITLFLFLISAAALITIPDRAGLMSAFVLIMLTPAAIIICLALSVLDHGELDAEASLDWTVRHGTIIVAVVVTFGIVYDLVSFAAGRLGMSHAAAVAIAAVAAVIAYRPLSRAVDRLRLKVLEKPQV